MLNREELYGELYMKFGRKSRMIAFADRVIDHCENWAHNKDVSAMDPKEVYEVLKDSFMQEEEMYRKESGFSFIPAFIWMWLLGQLVSFIIKWWLENRS